MAKMCKYVDYKTGGCTRRGIYNCPKNVNEKTCEIITPKGRRVKAWARWSIDGELFAVTGNYEDNTIPCTILISAKYLKGGK